MSDTRQDELLKRLSELQPADQRLVMAMITAMSDLNAGKLSTDDAATFKAVRQTEPYDLDAIEAWLIDHGYLAKVEAEYPHE